MCPAASFPEGVLPVRSSMATGQEEEAEDVASSVVNATDLKGNTALHKAAQQGKVDVGQVLIAAGADRRARNNDGQTPMDCAENAGNPKAALVAEWQRLLLSSPRRVPPRLVGD